MTPSPIALIMASDFAGYLAELGGELFVGFMPLAGIGFVGFGMPNNKAHQ